MSDVYQWFDGLATLAGFAYFVAGFACSFLMRWVCCKLKGQKMVIPWNYVGIIIGVVAIITTSIQSSEAYNTAKETALAVAQCQKEFNAALRARARVTTENDDLGEKRSQVVYEWIHDLIFPPAPYDSMATDDPRRQDYGFRRTIETDREFRVLIARQDELQRYRDANPLPNPTCGKP